MASPILKITDGNNEVDLLSVNSGLILDEWTPSIAPLKGGGVYQQSVLSDGKQLVMANYDNAIETFSLKIHGGSQDSVIAHSQNILRILQNARTYWFTPFQTDPVWLVARAPEETNTRYAIIHNFSQDGLDNPYAMPFFAACGESAMDNIVVSIERGHWQNVTPGEGECAAITGSSETSVTTVEESVTANGDDLSATLGASGHTAVSLQTGVTYLATGRDYLPPNSRRSACMRFSAVDIPDEATITSARLRLVAAGTSISSYLNRIVTIYGEDADDAAQITTVPQWNSRVLTTESENKALPFPHTAGYQYDFYITDIFNEIRDRVGWTDGNAMQFFIDELDCDNGAQVNFASFENTTYTEPKLIVEYVVSRGVVTPTCDDEVWAVDKYNLSTLTHVYLWDGAAWSANLINNATIDCADTPPAVGDKIYFGSLDTGENDQGPFTNIIFDVLTGGISNGFVDYAWEYWQGAPTSAWTSFVANRFVDPSQSFWEEGPSSFTFMPPMDTINGDWVTGDLNAISADGVPPSVTGWWIRARVTSVGGGTTEPSQIAGGDHKLYSATWPNVNIDATQIGGDIPAIARIKLDDSGQYGNPGDPLISNRVVLALSSDRGPYGGTERYDFSAYLPAPYQQPSVIEHPYGYSHIDFSLADDVTAPSGKVILLNPSGTGTREWYLTVNSLHFFGSYRAFVRVRQVGGSDDHFKVKLQTLYYSGGTVYAETSQQPVKIQSTNIWPNWQLLDLGLIDIPTGLPGRTTDEGAEIFLNVHTTVENATGDLRFMDIILMPTDEWIADVQDIGEEGFANGYNLHLDSISVPKVDLRSLAKKGGSPLTVNPIAWKTVGQRMRLPARHSCKLWVLTAQWNSTDECWVSNAMTTTRIQLFTVEQYLGLRGSS
ncbi:MAG: hypothetical protein ACW99G_10310 [Candidatus Thorarchaeota archaeon]|jgi:hypothetical protein